MSKASDFDRLAALGAPGMAAYFVMAKLMRALRAKGVLSDIELAAIVDAARDLARQQGDPARDRLASHIARALDDLETVVRETPPAQARH